MKPLEGIKVVELSTMITASFAAMMMAEQGASVIKVEPLELGDPMRHLGSNKGGISGLFANCNRGKRSLSINLKADEGKALLKELAAEADVLLCNYRPGVMDELGVGSDVLRAANPRLIYAAISGFGAAGPERNTPAYDPVIQARSGIAASQGIGAPEFVRNLTCDKITAYTACQAVTAALFQRERTGEGQHIELSMLDAGLFFIFPDGFMHHTLLDEDVEHHPPLSMFLYDLAETRDGAVTISGATEAQQIGLIMAIEQVHLMADERFNSQEKLLANLEEFRALLADVIKEFTTDELLERLKAHDVPAAKLLTHEEVLAQEQLAAMGSIDTAPHPHLGTMRRVKAPAMFGGERLAPARDCPAHGEHNAEILAELGRDEGAVQALRDSGVLG